jgi:hypothetical protein
MICGEYLTGTPDEHKLTAPGMAYFADTGPFGKTCKDCAFKGYRRTGREKYDPAKNDWVRSVYRCGGCAMFHKLTGRHGPAISGHLRACRYFQQKAKAS